MQGMNTMGHRGRGLAAAALICCAATTATTATAEVAAEVAVDVVRHFDYHAHGGGCNGDLVEVAPGEMLTTCRNGGENSHGTVIRVGPGGQTTVLLAFRRANQHPHSPEAGLTLGDDGLLYGSTVDGGINGNGTLFKMTRAGKLTVLHHFTGGSGGSAPYARLLRAADGRFYGTTWVGGQYGQGVAFRLSPSGKYKVIHQFTGGADGGGQPAAELVQLADGNFYGTTQKGGKHGRGVVFRMSPKGELKVLHSFGGGDDGWAPRAGLADGGDGFLYGTATFQSMQVQGTVFRIRPDGRDFAVLHRFTGDDGSSPWAPLRPASDGLLYGTTDGLEVGAVYRVTPGSGAVEVLHAELDLLDAKGGLLPASDGALYGTTYGFNWNGGPSLMFKVSGF